MSIRRSVSALLAGLLLAVAAAGQTPVPSAASPFPAAFAPVQASPFPPVFAPLTPATPITAPLPVGPAPVGIAPYPPPPGPPTLGQFLGLSYPQREYRQRRLARTPLGQLREKVQAPLSKLTGGLIPEFPPKTPTLAELQAPGPIGAAAKVKLDREGAIDRIKAVEYLGTVDCHYWPEAEDGLVGALRNDRNEWVRLAAAETLGKGCCCTKKTITALSMVVSCSMEDGAPVEKSPRVIAAAQAALARCLAMACACQPALPVDGAPVAPDAPLPEEKPRGEQPDAGTLQAAYSKPGPAGSEKPAGGLAAGQVAKPTGAAFYERVKRMPWGNVIAAARTALMHAPEVPADVQLAGASRDLELSGVDLDPQASTASPRPANLLDLLTGDERPEIKSASLGVTVGPGVVLATTVGPTPAPVIPTPAVATRTPMAAPIPTLRPVPAAAVTRAEPTPTPATPRPAATAPALQPAAKKPEPAVVPASVSKPAAPMSPRAARVADLLAAKADPRSVEPEVDQLTADDLAGGASLAQVLMTTAEEHKDPWLRAACIRALGRGKVNTPGVVSGLERLLNDRMTTVRVDAAVALSAIRGK